MSGETAAVDLSRARTAILAAREIIPDYGSGAPIGTGDVRRLADAVAVRVHRSAMDMDLPAVLTPPWRGSYRLILAPWVPPLVARHVTLHEIGHVLMGDIEEPTVLAWTGPMPEAEDLADLFSLVALLDDVECDQGPEFVEARIRELVPLENYGWQTYRVPRLAPLVGRVKDMVAMAPEMAGE